MPLLQTKGAGSAQGFGEFAATSNAVYIENVFSTWNYVGNGSSQTITNGIDLNTKGGLVWGKNRTAAWDHYLADTAQGVGRYLISDSTAAVQIDATSVTNFTTTGFSIGNAGAFINNNNVNYASWTFRKQPKFFDIVTYTGTGTSNRAIAHNLGSAPGCVIVKSTSNVQNWPVYHRSTGANTIFWLNATNANTANVNYFPTAPDATSFYVGTDTDVNQSGYTYVAYIFAHNAGGFGLTGSDNVISCGSFTNDASGNATVTLGYEPQWIMYKRTDAVGNWVIIDSMRGLTVGADSLLLPNSSAVEDNTGNNVINPTATGFYTFLNPSTPYIYIAIRRGPMKVPTVGTSVFYPTTYSGNVQQAQNAGFNGDLLFAKQRTTAGDRSIFIDRMRGATLLNAVLTTGELTPTDFGLSVNQFPSFIGSASSVITTQQNNYAYIPIGDAGWNGGANTYVDYAIARAPKVFDIVCYTGTGSNTTVTHNLGAVPELMIIKRRDSVGAWSVWNTYIAGLNAANLLELNAVDAVTPVSTAFNSTSPTSSVFTVGTAGRTNGSGGTYVAYLFATCPGVSKVGTYSGSTSNPITVNCGFTSGARFVMIKRTDSTSSWYFWDSARGISSGTDPYLLMDTTGVEVTSTNWVDTDSTGFKVTAAAAIINSTGGTYLFLAIA